jgi:4,5-dihydroxyphthalate decarboxylase
LAWTRHLFEEERDILGRDLWPIGLEDNRNNLDRFLDYMMDQRLLSKKPRLEELFPPAFAIS